LIKTLRKIPTWALTLILGALCCCSMYYSVDIMSATVIGQYVAVTKAVLAILLIVTGFLRAFIDRLFARLVYVLGNRIFFARTRGIPDYNLRRLPFTYPDFLRWVMLWLIIYEAIHAVLVILMYAAPYALNLLSWMGVIFHLVCLGLCYFCIDRNHVPAWQSGRCFVSLGIPAGILFVLGVILTM